MTETPLVQPLALGALLDEALRRFRRHFREVFLPVALPVGLMSGTLPLIQGSWFRMMGAMEHGGPDPTAMIVGFVVLFGGLLLFSIVYGLGYAAMIVGCTDAVAARPISMKRAWLFVLQPRVAGTILLGWLAVSVGFVLCLLPGLYLALLFALVVCVMVEEGRYGPGALSRSAELARYNPRRDLGVDPRVKTFVLLFVGLLLSYLLSFLIQLPAVVAQQVFIFRSAAGGERVDVGTLMARLAWVQVPTSILGSLAQTAVHVYVAMGLALLFFDVRHRREGDDLEAAVRRLAGGAASAGPEPPGGPTPVGAP